MRFRRFVLPISGILTLLCIGVFSSPTASAFGNPGQMMASNCGGTIYKSDGTPWTCTFDDEFSGTTLNLRNWAVQTNFSTGDPSVAYACYLNNPSNVSVSGGALHLTVHSVSKPVTCAGQSAPTTYTAGMVSTYRLFSQAYGRWEARIRDTATTSPGLQESFWLWPDDRYATINWPTTGEIDIAETYSQYSGLAIPFLHYTANDNGGPIPGTNTAWNCSAPRGVWNVYDLTWTPTSITIDVNGATCLVNTSADPAFNQRYIVALTAALGQGTNALTLSTPLPATTDVDYVRVWK